MANALGEEYEFISVSNIPSRNTEYSYGGGEYEVSRFFYIFAPAWSFYAHLPSEWWYEWIKPHYRTVIVVNAYDPKTRNWDQLLDEEFHGNDENAYLNCNCSEYSESTTRTFSGYRLYEVKVTPNSASGEDGITIRAKSLKDSNLSFEGEENLIYGGNGSDFVMLSSLQDRNGAINHFSDSMKGSMITKSNSHFINYVKL